MWPHRDIESLCTTITSGGTPKRSDPSNYDPGTIPWIKTAELQDAEIVSSEERISQFGLAHSSAKILPPSTVLMAMYGATVGKLGITQFEMTCNQASCAMITDPARTSARWLFYSLLRNRADLVGLANGAAQQNLSARTIRHFQIPVPPLSEQKAIAEVLGALDDKISANRRLVTTAESYLRAIFDRDLASNDLPTSPLDSIVQLNPKRPAPKDPAPLIPMQTLPTPGITIPEFTRDTPKGGVRFTNGDTLLARITPCLENGKTAFVGSLAEGEIGIGSTEYIVLRSIEPYPLEVSYFIATDATFRAEAIRRMTGTSGRQRVKAQDVARVPIHLTSDRAAMRQFGDLARSCFQHAEILSAESRTLASLRDTLLPALMDGTIRVKDAETHVEEVL